MKHTLFTLNNIKNLIFFRLIIFSFISLIGFINVANARSSSELIGKTSPTFVLPDTNGKQHSLKEWSNKLIIVNFWATWCTPCKKEIPLFSEFQNLFSDDIQFVGIAIDNVKDVKKFAEIIPLSYPSLIGGFNATKLVLSFGNKAGVLPYTVFINQRGKIITIVTGEITREFLLNTIEKHL